jgi:hypothetical protein
MVAINSMTKCNTNGGAITMKRMRTLEALARHYRRIDPETAITQHFLRKRVISGEIPCVKAGVKRLIAIEDVDEYINDNSTHNHQK